MTISATNQFSNGVGGFEIKVKPSLIKLMMNWWSEQYSVLVSEFTSTTLLLFLGCMTTIPLDGFDIQPPMYAAIGFGTVVLFNISTFGHISGAHMNPSVTVSALIFGNMPLSRGIGYIIVQCLGAIAGYGLLMVVSPVDLIPGCICTTTPHPNQAMYQALITEIILSTALAFLNCSVWDPINKEKVDGIPLRFGFTIAALSLAGGPLTGASMNPARSLAPALWTGKWTLHWVYWVGPIIGGAFGPIFYKLIFSVKEKI